MLIERWTGKATLILVDQETKAEVEFEVEQEMIDVSNRDETRTVRGLMHWQGTFAAAAPIPLVEGEILLEDGRRGRIIIKAVDYVDVTPMGSAWRQLKVSAQGEFVGNGAPPLA